MGLSADDYLGQAQALLPPGPAWPRDASAYATRLLLALSVEFARVDERVATLLVEADPRNTTELLIDWERVAGLPDGCVVDAGAELSTTQRRTTLLTRLTMVGAQSANYFVGLAASLGYEITVQDFKVFDVNDDVESMVLGTPWMHAWRVTSVLNQPSDFTAESGVSDALSSWSNVVLECVLNRFRPAHSVLVFAYT